MGEFDQLIAQELMRNRSQRGDEPNQRARDFAARQMNAKAGNAPSTAWPEANRAPVVADNRQMSMALPQQAPIPASNPMNEAIEAQLAGEGVGNPQLAAMQPPAAAPAQEMGDASVAEQMSPMMEMIAQQMGEQQGPPMPTQAAPSIAMPEPSPGMNGTDIASIVAGLGGAYGVRELYKRYQAGDPDATRIFAATGMSPDDFAMFADDLDPSRVEGGIKAAPADSGKSTQPSRARPSPNTVQKPNTKPRGQTDAPAVETKVKGNTKPKTKMGPDHPDWPKPKVKVK